MPSSKNTRVAYDAVQDGPGQEADGSVRVEGDPRTPYWRQIP